MKRTVSIGRIFFSFQIAFSISSGVLAQTSTPTPYPDSLFDHDQDGDVDSQDLLLFLQKWGIQGIVTSTPSSTLTPTPTPTQTPPPPPTETLTATPTPSATETPTSTSTHTPTFTPTETSTITPTPSPSETPTNPDTINVGLPAPFIKMVRIPAGSFMMGSPDTERGRKTDEGPLHEVTIDYDFYIGETEVTQAQWTTVMGSNPSPSPGIGLDYPVRAVSWFDCQDFIAALNASGQGTFRLPSEAEWEYACRFGSTTRFYFGDSLGCDDNCSDCETGKGVIFIEKRSHHMWFCSSGVFGPSPVRQLSTNGFGLYDMAGNLWEWCEDSYHSDYTGAPTDGSPWLDSQQSTRHVVRGGHYGATAAECRSASRLEGTASTDFYYFGFRVVREP